MKRVLFVIACVLILLCGILTALIIGDSTAPDTLKGAEPASLSLTAGEARVISLIEGMDEPVTDWSSSDETVVTVDSGGRADGLKEGKAEITARFANDHTYTWEVSVAKAQPEEKADTFTTAITANSDILARNLQNPVVGNKRPYRLHVNRKMNCVTAYTYDSDGKYTVPVRAMVCSCGLNNSTITGIYNIYFHTEWHPLVNGVVAQYASAIAGDYMFHSVPYTDYSKSLLKVDEYNKLGQDASSGCIRMAVGDVKWINDNCEEGTIVFLYDGDVPGPLGKPEGMKLNDPKCCWDPTDDVEENPYRKTVPQIKGAASVTIEEGSDYSMTGGVTAVDSCGNDITGKMEVIGNADAGRAGVYKVTYRVTDVLHRSAQTDITVTVTKKTTS